jgi:hypothetical protein
LGSESPAGRQHHLAGGQGAGGRREVEEVVAPRDRGDPVGAAKLDAEAGGLAEEGVEDGPRAVGVGEELAAVLDVQGDADLLEEGDRPVDGEGGEDAAHDVGAAAPEIGGFDGLMSDVASAASADEDLGADFRGSVQEGDAEFRLQPRGEDGGGQPGRAGAHHGDVQRLTHGPPS